MTSSQTFESYVPVYDAIPEKWENAKPFIVENFKKISEALNIREIGWLLDEELLSGKQFIPVTAPDKYTPIQYRSVFRKVVNTGALVAGANAPIAHGISFTNIFTLIDMWVSGTNSGTLTARVINGNDVLMDQFNINITSPQIFDRSYCIIEYMQEI